ncbi:11384_t:CDS:2 [Scutellospora calospora]|uniref:11384_t:CDS:1 n=1 Tax=Scutellospora calospora TaxID=85575 RepID=A0ACA9K3Y4_9GLOM|nr:11384_t:CDS:2 [Scutellospora calospora]
MAKLHESVGNIKEFSDALQAKTSSDISTDISEIVSTLAITDMSQNLFNSIIDQPECLVASISISTNISLLSKIVYVEPVDDKAESSSKIIDSLLVRDIYLCKNLARRKYCILHAFKIRKDIIILQLYKGCGQETKLSVQLCVLCRQGRERAYRYYVLKI